MGGKDPLLPEELARLLDGYGCSKNTVGRSAARVCHYRKNGESLFLKIQSANNESRREYELLKWLSGRLPVPEVRYYCEEGGVSYLLMTAMQGHMACVCPEDSMCKPYETTVGLLAEGLKLLQSVDNSGCPFRNTLDIKLESALDNIRRGRVDIADFEESNDFESPECLYEWLVQNKPREEELCFTHGDYCLPNVFIDNGYVTGFIDLGKAGIADKWQDIALCVRSIGYNLRRCEDDEKYKYTDLLFEHLNIQPDWDKINYFILLDDLF